MRFSTFFIVLLFSNIFSVFSQNLYTIKGRITNIKGNALEYATVYVKVAEIGVTTNEQGDYSLRLPAGNYEIGFQYVGYEPKYENVTLNGDMILDIELKSESTVLEEVVINANELQDPAYNIIRQAQAKRKYYLQEEIKAYQCKVYVKSLQKLQKRPSTLFGRNIVVDTGVVYLSESVSELSYQQTNKWFEKMVSSRTSGNNRGFSFNQARESWVNLYENINAKEMTERGIVSPIANNAMSYYRYRLENSFVESGKTVHKIKLIPRRQNAPACGGYVYIMDSTWRIHSADLYIKKNVVDFVDSVVVHQVYKPLKSVNEKNGTDVWIPFSQKVQFWFNAFGFKGNGYLVTMFSQYNLTPNFPKKFFKNEVFRVEKEANKQDSLYWREIRPMPLTTEEVKDYRRKDSIMIIKETKVYKDSVDNKRNKFRLGNLFLSGYTYYRSYNNLSIAMPALPAMLSFNTVEGVVLNFAPTFRKRYEDRHSLWISPTIRYGFSNEIWQAKGELRYLFNPKRQASFSVEGGQFVEQISRTTSVSPFINTVYSLLDEQNFMKLYQKAFGKITYEHNILRGVRLNTVLEYAQRQPLQNTSDYRMRDVDGRTYTPNVPEVTENTNPSFERNNMLMWATTLTFNFGQKYITYPDRIFTTDSPFPTFMVNYRKGLSVLDSQVDYDFLMLRIFDDTRLGMFGESEWQIEGGTFVNTAQMNFVDYRHFIGNQTLLRSNEAWTYQLLPYYMASTKEYYAKAHYEHHFNGFLTNSIPFIKKLKWQLVASANYLYTPKFGNYAEIGAGFEHIFSILRIDYFTSWKDGQLYDTGLRIGLGF